MCRAESDILDHSSLGQFIQAIIIHKMIWFYVNQFERSCIYQEETAIFNGRQISAGPHFEGGGACMQIELQPPPPTFK